MKEFFAEFSPKRLFNSLTSGLLVGVIALINSITYGVMIYSPTGNPTTGVMFALINGLVLSVVFGLGGSIPGLVAFPQSAMTPVFALLVTNILASIPRQSPQAATATVMAAVLLASVTVGVAYWFLGFRNRGDIIRFMPYPVSGGFLAGLGWLLLKSGFSVSAGKFSLETLFLPDTLRFWIPAFLFGLLLFLVQEKIKQTWLTPALIVLGVAGFYLVMRYPAEELRQAGWLLTLSDLGNAPLFHFPLLEMWDKISWQAILLNVVTAVTLVFTAFISMLLNVNGIEMAVGKDMTPNRELRLAGVANLAAVFLGGGIVGYPSAGLTIMAYKRGQPGRLMGLVVSLMFGAALFYGFQYLGYLPKFVIGGLLISLGINFLYEWLVEGFFKFSRTDYLVVLAMFFTVTFFDLLAGVILGLVLMVIIFVLNYSKTNVIRSVLTGKNFQSNVDRPMKHMQYLRERGEQLLILRLQGYIFFGTAHTIYQYIKNRLEKHEGKPLRFVVIDFTQTYGIDSSAAMIFTKMRRVAEANNISLAFTSLDEKALKKLAHNGFAMDSGSARAFENMDYAVEWCESVLLSGSDMTVVTSRSLVENLGAFFDQAEFHALFAYMTRANAPEGHIVVQQGEPVPGLYLIERGRATVYREMQNGQKLRIRTLGAGTVIGETGLYTGAPASATVIIDVPSEIYLLTPEGLAKMEAEAPALASSFHHYIVQLLGQRLQYTTASVQALLE